MSVSTAAPLETLCSPGFCLMRLATTRPSGNRRVKRVPTPWASVARMRASQSSEKP